MIQDIAPHHLDNAYRPVPPDRDSIALCYEGRACLMKRAGEEIIFPRFADLEKENTEIYDFALTDAEMDRINALDRGEKHDWY